MMRHQLWRVRVLAGLLGLWAMCGSPRTDAAPEMDGPYLVNDLASALARARQTGRPIFLVFRCER